MRLAIRLPLEEPLAATLNNVALNGIALNGIALDGVALDGITLDGITLDGIALDRIALDGVALDRIALDGVALDRMAPAGGVAAISLDGITLDSSAPVDLAAIALDRIALDGIALDRPAVEANSEGAAVLPFNRLRYDDTRNQGNSLRRSNGNGGIDTRIQILACSNPADRTKRQRDSNSQSFDHFLPRLNQ